MATKTRSNKIAGAQKQKVSRESKGKVKSPAVKAPAAKASAGKKKK